MTALEAEQKNVKITMTDGEVFSGYCIEFVDADDNESDYDAIHLRIENAIYELFVNEISRIEPLK